MPTFNHPVNPFARGFNDLRIQRLLAILYDAQAPLCYLAPHPDQEHLTDDQFERQACLFNQQHAWVEIEAGELSRHAHDYPNQGIVVHVIHALYNHDHSPATLVADQYSRALAEECVQQLTFETGHYSRCWEISSTHLPHSAWSTLQAMLLDEWPAGLLFETFVLADSHALGFKLIFTPWSDAHLLEFDGSSAEQLRQQHLNAGLPLALVEVLHLAAQADVRILIFDPDATCLPGLTTFDDHP
ncbi:hypothetical protein SAMN04490182_2004 [Pseudomonas cedrina]|uniref:DUF5983 domain-containing protein n=2 Tax=Pseudomonas cedrina TaxID=651740 RepID=A0A1V2JZI9_PSECE|nr:hypothetical protein [Pseudomonas cedrina]ONH50912.1 hypothetical protein BLL36_23670 [Pseudomonas cedrina subsp. cedrina]SDS63266.1 hypothetical protein SAMN04490182_2004 [Pseudomonas cedrina]